MNERELTMVFFDTLNRSTNEATAILVRPRYPLRELRPRLSDGMLCLTVAKKGYGYKDHSHRPMNVAADVEGIAHALENPVFLVVSVEDREKSVQITIKEKLL